MTPRIVKPGDGERRQKTVERVADAVCALCGRLVLPEDLIELVGYIFLWATAQRIQAIGAEETRAAIQFYVAESIATAFDMATGIPGHGVSVAVILPGRPEPTC